MTILKTLIVHGVVAVTLAVLGLSALAATLDPSASEVAAKATSTADPLAPPMFYGSR